jgi:putative addiction module killer protein
LNGYLQRKLEAVRAEQSLPLIPLLVTHIATPELLDQARQNGIIVVQSFEWGQGNPDLRAYILELTRREYAPREETQDRFYDILAELRRDREEQTRKWEEQNHSTICPRTITLDDMYTIKQMPEFQLWLNSLRDRQTRFRLLRRLEKAQRGLLGDVASVGEGIFEMREFFGPGWRMYYIQRGEVLMVMLGGGDKSSQVADIASAKALAATLTDE